MNLTAPGPEARRHSCLPEAQKSSRWMPFSKKFVALAMRSNFIRHGLVHSRRSIINLCVELARCAGGGPRSAVSTSCGSVFINYGKSSVRHLKLWKCFVIGVSHALIERRPRHQPASIPDCQSCRVVG